MPQCSIKWCGKNSNTSSIQKDGITFHLYPQNAVTKEKWINATRRDNWMPSKYSVICSRHFTDDCFINMKNRRRLMKFAIPTLFLPLLSTGDVRDGTSNFELSATLSTEVEAGSSIIDLSTSPSTRNVQTEASVSKLFTTPKTRKKFPGSPSDYNSPNKKRLCRRVIELTNIVTYKNKQLRNLRERARYLGKKVASLKTVLNELQKEKLINSSDADLLSKIGITSRELIKRQILKSKKGVTIKKKYSPELRTFALTLNFYSAKAYAYVRKKFQTCLPSIKTLSKWYQTVDGKPGFTKEAFSALRNKAAQLGKDQLLIGTLVFDEMKVKNKVEFVPSTQRTFGYVDFGGNIQADCSPECSEALVLLVVGLNKKFKVPIGYFLTNGTNAEQKKNLLLQAIDLCYENNVTIKAVTFDGCPTNIAMAKELGCEFSESNIKSYFKHKNTNNDIFIFLDPVHMLKLVRNAFEYYKEFKAEDGGLIKWEYINLLHFLQEKEQFYLANKLRLSHIQFKQNIMKVKLAAQLFSRSVAKALQFCDVELKLHNFQNVEATVAMLLLINDLFDILDSRVHGYGFKRAINKENAPKILKRLNECKQYLLNLTVDIKKNNKFIKLIKSPRYTGFLGFCISITSACGMYYDLVERDNALLKYIPYNKISQDHLELFFSNIRSHGGSNDNPTPRQFEYIYKKTLIHAELMDSSTGNCVSLEQISILTCSSALTRINLTTAVDSKGEIDLKVSENLDDSDLNEALERIILSTFSEKAVEYIAGFVSSTLIKKLNCKTCIGALISINQDPLMLCGSLIAYRDMGGLIYPSPTVVKICYRSEKVIKAYLNQIPNNKSHKTDILVNKTLSTFIGEELFSDIKFHQFHSDETNHVVDLATSVMHTYISTRLCFLTKSAVQKPTVRRIYKKLIHFKNN